MKLVKLLSFFIAMAIVACGEPGDLSNESKSSITVDPNIGCKENLEKCGKMAMSSALTGFPTGTTMTTSIAGSGSTVYNANYNSASTAQTYSLLNGTYCVVNTRVYPPVATISTRSLVQIQVGTACFTIAAPNLTMANVSVAIIDADGDGIHDYIDCTYVPSLALCQTGVSGSFGTTVTSNDSDGDGCANTIDPQPSNPLVGCGGSPATTSTAQSYAFWTQAEALTWQCFSSCSASVVSDTTRKAWVVVMVVKNGLTMAHQQLLYKDGGSLTIGQARNFSGKMQCSVNGTTYLEIENPADFSSAANLYYPVSVTPTVSSPFSANYTATKTIASKRTTIKVGMLSQSSGTTTCYFWHLRDQ